MLQFRYKYKIYIRTYVSGNSLFICKSVHARDRRRDRENVKMCGERSAPLSSSVTPHKDDLGRIPGSSCHPNIEFTCAYY